MEIKSISEKIFRTSPSKAENSSNHTNPFGVSFKGNMISADVFETAAKSDAGVRLIEKVSNKGKMLASAIVGSIGDMNSAISTRLNSIANFGRRIGENVAKAWNWMNNTNLVINIDTAERVSKNLFKIDLMDESRFRVKNLMNHKNPNETLRPMFEELVAIAEAV